MSGNLHPEAAEILDRLTDDGVPPLHSLSVSDLRHGGAGRADTDPSRYADEAVRELSISGHADDLRVRVYDPGGDHPLPILLYFHGGGWVFRDVTDPSIDALCRLVAVEGACLVVSVDYRLAPEHQFPAQLRDATAALEWVAEHGDTIGGDPDRIAVGGDSAGGNLAAALALYARDHDGPAVRYQLLWYPVTNFAFDTESYRENATGYYLTRRAMQQFWNWYLGDPIHGANPYASPLRHPDHAGVAPAYVLTCEFDPLRDDGRAYADRLKDAGVPVTYTTEPGMIHGILNHVTRMDRAHEVATAAASHLRDALAD